MTLAKRSGSKPAQRITKLKDGTYQTAFSDIGMVTHSKLSFIVTLLKDRGLAYYIRDQKED